MEDVIYGISSRQSEKTAFIAKTYGWMALALFLSALSAFVTASSRTALTFLFGNGGLGFIVLLIAEIALVLYLSHSIRKMSVMTAAVCFVSYSLINGAMLSSILFVYTFSSIAATFLGCSAMFGVMAVYGAKTQKNLDSVGRYCMMALLGIVFANLLQFVLSLIFKMPFTMMTFLISLVSVVVFTGLTAYDSQKVMQTAEYANGNDDYKKVSIYAALQLYLDFINLFLALLRLFGKRR